MFICCKTNKIKIDKSKTWPKGGYGKEYFEWKIRMNETNDTIRKLYYKNITEGG